MIVKSDRAKIMAWRRGENLKEHRKGIYPVNPITVMVTAGTCSQELHHPVPAAALARLVVWRRQLSSLFPSQMRARAAWGLRAEALLVATRARVVASAKSCILVGSSGWVRC
jgi:hypothetical protein